MRSRKTREPRARGCGTLCVLQLLTRASDLTLRVTPAMEALLSDHIWSIEELRVSRMLLLPAIGRAASEKEH